MKGVAFMRKITKLLSYFLAFTMLFTMMDLQVFAEEATMTENAEIKEETGEESLPTTEILPGDSSLLEHFVVSEPYLQTPAEETFVLSFNDCDLSSIFLYFQNENGVEEKIPGSLEKDHLYVFKQSFDEKDTGSYTVNKLQYVKEEKTYEINFSDLNMDIRFGVNQKYEGYGKNVIDPLEEPDEEFISDTIASADISDLDETESAVTETLSKNIISTFGLLDEEEEPLVICLDPGHGGVDPGTYTLDRQHYEKEYTLKIAKYIKEELEKYNNVKVVMTRDADVSVELEERAEIAKQAGADVLISLHLNASPASAGGAAQGAEVYYPNSNYNQVVSEEGKKLSQAILDELVNLGIKNRGIKVRTVFPNDYNYLYPDGSCGDYYGVIRHSKKRGIPGIIVEHCCADNYHDFYNFLNSEAKIKQLARAEVQGIVKKYHLSKEKPVYSKEEKLDLLLTKDQGIKSQQWKIDHDEKGYLQIENVNSGKVLDVKYAEVKNGTKIHQYTSNGSRAQKWIAIQDGKEYAFVSALDPEYVLDFVNGTVQIHKIDDSSHQRWIVEKYATELDKLAWKNKDALKNGVYMIQSKVNENYGLDVKNGSHKEGANVQLYKNNGTEAQKWKITHDEKGYVTIENVGSGKCLDVLDSKAKNGSNVQQKKANHSMAQKWIAIRDGNSYKFVSALHPDYVLDLFWGQAKNGSNIQLYESNDSDAQRWSVKKDQISIDQLAMENKKAIKDGIYTIRLAKNKKYVLDVKYGSRRNQANIQLYEFNNTNAQKWKISHDSKGYVMIENIGSKKMMDVDHAIVKNSANIYQYSSNNLNSQKWIAIKKGNSYVLVSSMNPDYALDLHWGEVKNESNIQLYEFNNTDSQKWVFEK